MNCNYQLLGFEHAIETFQQNICFFKATSVHRFEVRTRAGV